MTSTIKLQLTGLELEVERLKSRELQKDEELKEMKERNEEREDDNRYLRNQLLNKDQDIFKLKTYIAEKEKEKQTVDHNIISEISLPENQNDIYDSEIVPLS
jgi:hypothetical protein